MARIMVVEDEPLVAADVEECVRALGHELAPSASSGHEAIQHARAQPLDLVLMDIRLEGSMDGVETARRLRRDFQVPVVFMTAFADKQTIQRAVEVEPLGYVLKPFANNEVGRAIEVALSKQRARALRDEREEWLETAFRSLSEAVILLNDAHRIVLMNAVAEGLASTPPEQATGKPWREVFPIAGPGARDADALVERAVREGAALSASTSLKLERAAGEGLPVELSVMPMQYGRASVPGVVVVLRDVREQRRIASELSMSERLTALGTFASGLAHEVNNPLTATVAGLDLALHHGAALASELTSAGPLDRAHARGILDDMLSALRSAEAGGERIERVLKDLSLFSRPGRERRPLAMSDVLQSAVRLVENQLQHRARLVLSLGDAPLVDGNEGQLARAFVGLLVNAAEAISEGQAERNAIRVVLRSTDDGNGCCVEIEDTGSGITPDLMVRMYEPFFTTKPVGTGMGLGLSIAHSVIAAHGGELAVRSEPGRGSTFTVRLPASRERARVAPPVRRQETPRRLRMLIVDDERLIGDVLEQTFRDAHDVTVTTSARAALDILAERTDFDVILSDISMPELDGIRFYEIAQQQYPALASKFVFMTGGAFTPRTELFLAGLKGRYVLKPLRIDALERLLLAVGGSSTQLAS